ncbi:hypothetical protein [Azospirillum canadense]|uniref:hypothetical protein n=1 Tax=Azospirillum canadense TaxID=403962 RepID=UPI0022265BDF|nr:hypothetical protein [Azospirillum canadense]MCW2242317.1 hypothetical protein [Azospirillum canadense]
MTVPPVYYVSPFATTDLEPSRGWYVGRLTDNGQPNGPFISRERAESWRADAVHGLMLDRRAA